MSAVTPAFLNAAARKTRSAVSQRADEAASGRITPTCTPAAVADDADTKPVSARAADAMTAATALRRFVIYVVTFRKSRRPGEKIFLILLRSLTGEPKVLACSINGDTSELTIR